MLDTPTDEPDEPITLELDDIQGLVARGYGTLPTACFVLLQVTDAAAARAWLRSVLPLVTTASRRPESFALHVAWTHAGLRALGLADEVLETFPRELREGMATPERARVLGDGDARTLDGWSWGGPRNEPLHVMTLLYACDRATLEARHEALLEGCRAFGLIALRRLDSEMLPDEREHFGFRDGMGQPIVEGLGHRGPADNTVRAGEFVLGYRNGYGRLPGSPHVPAGARGASHLPSVRTASGESVGDLGRNGSYVVFRELRQDVAGFWRFLDERTRRADGRDDPGARLGLAAKMVGRWPGGAPLTLSPDGDDGALGGDNGFGFRDADREGHGCPLGSHIRRANPRNALGDSARESVEIVNRHRVLRRGRPFGPPLDGGLERSPLPDDDGVPRGLHFICLNADIGRQFEFVQQTWLNNPKFDGLRTDSDPLVGVHYPNATFTMPARPFRRRLTGMRRFVEAAGGAYLFMPGIAALHFMAEPC